MKPLSYVYQFICFVRIKELNHNIYIAADPTLVDVDIAARAGGPTLCTQRIIPTHRNPISVKHDFIMW